MISVPRLVCALESTTESMAELRDSKCAEYWTHAMKSWLERLAVISTSYDENISQRVNIIYAKWIFAWKIDSNEYITKVKSRLVARGFGQHPGVDYFKTFAPPRPYNLLKWLWRQLSSRAGSCSTGTLSRYLRMKSLMLKCTGSFLVVAGKGRARL